MRLKSRIPTCQNLFRQYSSIPSVTTDFRKEPLNQLTGIEMTDVRMMETGVWLITGAWRCGWQRHIMLYWRVERRYVSQIWSINGPTKGEKQMISIHEITGQKPERAVQQQASRW